MMRKVWIGPLIAAATAASLAGCNRNASPPSSSADTAPGAAVAQAPYVEGSPLLVNSADGVHIEYRIYGQGEPAVVLIHGWACNENYWNAQTPVLKAAHYTVVLVDLAGHGASGKNRSDWSMGNYGEDVASVVRQLPNRQVVLVGHSMGGLVALEATRRIGDRVIGIVAVDALKSIGQPPMPQKQIETRVDAFRRDFIGETRKFVAQSLFPQSADLRFVNKVAYDMSLASPAVAVASMEALLSTDLAPIVADIHVPVMAINSDLEPTDAARIRKSLPDFTAEVIPHTSHFLMMDDTARFNPVLLRDIATLAQKAGSGLAAGGVARAGQPQGRLPQGAAAHH
jgi:pimeloyl-ACP methyl ester carboxylesterase